MDMRLSSVNVSLSEKDILSLIDQFVEVEGLSIKSINIDELISIEGEYKKGVTIPFKAKLGIGNVINNCINISIFDVKVAKIGVLNSVKKLAMKALLKDLVSIGLTVDGETLNLNLNKLSKSIPYVYFNLKSAEVENGFIKIEAQDIIYTEEKETISIKHKETKNKRIPAKDGYTSFRKNIINKVPSKYEKIATYSMILPDIIALLYRLFLDKRVSIKTKVLAAGILGYLVSPIDILPDFIPFIGEIDDIAVAFYGLNTIINDVPEEVILDNWQGEENVITIVNEGVKYIGKIAGSENIAKLVNFIKGLGKKTKKEEKDDEEGSDLH